ncbi:Mitofusin-1, partial [Desmophyllum pertusum]
EFPKVGQQLRDLTEKLQKVKKICTKYYEQLRVEQATPKKCKDFRQLTEYLTKIRDDLKNVQEKEASKEITIAFAGATSSGKSSVINALLRERCLPVGCAQTTMCIFKVCLKKDDSDEWSVEIDGKTPKTGKGEKAVNDLLSLMSGSKHRVEREHLKIGTESVVEVNWPLKCKLLPANVVLIDTPGFGEGKKSDKVVTDSCNKADIIVAVMDVMSPSRGTVSIMHIFSKGNPIFKMIIKEN